MVLGAVNTAKKKAKRELSKFRRESENARRSVYGEDPIETFADKKKRFLGKLFPPLLGADRHPPTNCYETLFYTGTFLNSVLRFLLIWIFCQVVGLVFFALFTLKYPYSPVFTATTAAITIQTVTVLIFVIPCLRILLLLAIPSLLTSKMRTLLMLLIVGWAFQSAAQNITTNIQQTASSITCVQVKMKTLMEEVLSGTKMNAISIANSELTKVLQTLRRPVDKMLSVLRTIQNGIEKAIHLAGALAKDTGKLIQGCHYELRQPYFMCITMFYRLYHDCMRYSPFGCEFIKKFEGAICSLGRNWVQMCEFPDMVKDKLKDKASQFQKLVASQAIDKLKENAFFSVVLDSRDDGRNWKNISVDTKFAAEFHEHSTLNKTMIVNQIKEDLKLFETFNVYIAWIADLLIYPVMTLPFIMACSYLYRFVTKEKSDNFFISSEFVKIDKEREAKGETTLLPLTPSEKEKLVSTFSFSMVTSESLRVTVAIGLTIIGAIIPALLVIVDIGTYRVLYEAYDFFHSNETRVEFPSMYALRVSGDGFLSNLYRSVLKIMEPVGEQMRSRDESWRDCFIEPSPPNYKLFKLMFLMFLAAIALCFIKVYASRARHLIAEHYFPERKRPRALFLYNQILEERKTVLSACMKMAKDSGDAAELIADEEEGRGHLVNHSLPKIGNDYHSCVRCGRADLKLANASNARVCCNCSALYCVDCFSVKNRCEGCNFLLQIVTHGVEFYMDSSCDEFEAENDEQLPSLMVAQSVTEVSSSGRKEKEANREPFVSVSSHRKRKVG